MNQERIKPNGLNGYRLHGTWELCAPLRLGRQLYHYGYMLSKYNGSTTELTLYLRRMEVYLYLVLEYLMKDTLR